MVQQYAENFSTRHNYYVPACGYAADVIHGAPYECDFGTPAAADADAVINDLDIDPAGSTTTFLSSEADATYGRNLTFVASSTATSTITVHGWDYLGQPMSETITLNSGTPVVGTKAFKRLRQVDFALTASITVDIGWGARFGLPYRATHCLGEQADGVAAAAGTITAGVRTDPQTATTTDPRGLYTPTTTPNGAKRLVAFFLLDGFVNSSGNGGLMGIRHYSA